MSELDILHRRILNGKDANDEEKLNLSSNIESLKNQLSQANPDKTIINKLWEGIKGIATLNDCVSLVLSR